MQCYICQGYLNKPGKEEKLIINCISSRKIFQYSIWLNIKQRRFYMLQNLLVTSSLGIGKIKLFLWKFSISENSKRRPSSHIHLPNETETFQTNLRKCLAYLFLYLKVVIRWISTRQLVFASNNKSVMASFIIFCLTLCSTNNLCEE